MTNEEKILELLEKMQADIAGLKETQSQQGDTLEHMGQRLDHIDDRSQRTAVLLETEVDRKLSLLYEGHDAIMEHLDRLAPRTVWRHWKAM